MTLATKADEISEIAFGFMGSKALFAALQLKVFTHLADGPLTAEELARKADVHPDRAQTLLTALASLGLIEVHDGDRFGNAPASQSFLVNGAKYDFGDYLRLQVGRQMYSLLDQIENALQGTMEAKDTASYAQWFADPDEARLYSESQHSGSVGPARQLSAALDLSGARRMLDVGGGTGAFAITLCKDNPELTASIVEFPNVADLGRAYVEKAGLSDRIAYVPGNALEAEWPGDQDVILMSYLLSGVPGDTHVDLIRRAYDHLVPGGRLLIHDFVVEKERTGPKLAALWQLQHTAFTPEARSLDAGWLAVALDEIGYSDVQVAPLIPKMTMLAQGVKPVA